MDKQKIFDFALKIFLFLSPIFFFKAYPPSFARGMFFVLGTFALFALSLSLEPKRKFSNIWVSLFLLFAFVRIFFNNNCVSQNAEWFNFWMSCAGFIYVFCGVLLFKTIYSYTERIEKYFKPIVWVCIINATLVLAQIVHWDFMWTNAPSICGFMENSSQLGQYSAIALPIIACLNPLLALIPLFTLIASKSISPILAGVVGVAFLSCFKGRIWKIRAGVGVLLALLVFFNFGYVKAKFECRPVMWQKTLKSAMQKPYLGHGYRSFNDKVLEVGTKADCGRAEYSRPHNDYLHTAQELGFPILICVAMFFIGLFKKFKATKKDKLVLCLASSVLIVLVNMSGQSLIRYASVVSTFIVILALLCVKIEGESYG